MTGFLLTVGVGPSDGSSLLLRRWVEVRELFALVGVDVPRVALEAMLPRSRLVVDVPHARPVTIHRLGLPAAVCTARAPPVEL
jgi:hypothetical protein